MALNTNQIGGLDDLNKRIADGYQATAKDTANLNYGKSKGYTYNPIPTGATKIAAPSGLQGLNESQLFRQGQDIYKLPDISNNISTNDMSNTPIVNGAEVTPSAIPNLMAGLDPTNKGTEAILKAQEAQLQSQAKANELQTEGQRRREEMKTSQRDLQVTTQEEFGLKKNSAEVQKIMPQIAQIKAAYDNAEIAQEGRKGTAGSIYGRQALIQRQRAVELAGLSAVAQAYQGNVDLARQISQDAITAQYQDTLNYNNSLNTQLDAVYQDLNREDKVKADQLKTVIDERNRKIEEEKVNRAGIFDIAMLGAKNNIDSGIVNQILKATTPEKAMEIAFKNGVFKDNTAPTKIGVDSDGNDIFYDNGTFKTGDQLTSFQLGNQVGTILGLPSYSTRSANPGVNRSDRNNNPGNIKVSSYSKGFEGVIAVENDAAADGGNFLIFDSPESGIKAIGQLLLDGKSYQGVTAEQAIKKYNGNGAYGASNLGLDPNKNFQEQIQDPNKRYDVAKKIAMAEGWSGGLSQGTQEMAISPEAENWAKNIRDGKSTIANVPEKMRTEVSNALALLPNSADTAGDADAKQKAQQALDLINHNGLSNAVGTIGLGRHAPFQWGQKADFIGGVEQLVSTLSLESLINAKSRGATFGALSDTEMRILASSATKIGSWTLKKDGRVTGYKVGEKAMKEELGNISKIFLRAIKSEQGGITQSLDTYLQNNPNKVSEYNTILTTNPNLTDEEILQVINQ